jgi:twitching motility two-component system response regulator PilG
VLTGRKLLLADDSAAIRKVIELTFSDEGMEVITVPDGRSAFEKMGQVRPDLVLADVHMPEVGGYELCRSIKQDERFARTPVVLLISSFEPFDEAEARRAGADDVVTKPFQSIRQLVSRVGSLLNKADDESEMTHQYSMLGISETEPVVPAPVDEQPRESQGTVLVEAPVMEHVEPTDPAGVACSTDVEIQTADTLKLERVVDEPLEEAVEDLSLQDTMEVEPVEALPVDDHVRVEPEPETVEVSYRDISEPLVETPPPAPMKLDDAVLDLEDEYVGEPQIVGDDVFLDLDFADAVPAEAAPEIVAEVAPAPFAFDQTVPVEAAVESEQPSPPAFDEPPAIVMPDESVTLLQSSHQPRSEPEAEEVSARLATHEAEGLSQAAIDAIARRMVEQMSDKVIREIAWEVVPELSELLIKRKLEEQK